MKKISVIVGLIFIMSSLVTPVNSECNKDALSGSQCDAPYTISCMDEDNITRDCCETSDDCENTYGSGYTGQVGGKQESQSNSFNSIKYADIVCPGAGNSTGIKTALGCLATEPTAFISTLLNFGIGIAGGIAFLLLLVGGLQILTSAGNPEQLAAGRELMTSAIVGLLLIIFSIFILRLIGVNVLGIPGFG